MAHPPDPHPGGPQTLRLGLIGDNIAASRSPDLHRICGELSGLNVTYDLINPLQLNQDFETVLARCQRSGMRGVNVTYPYKERVTDLVKSVEPDIARLGAINTVVFTPAGPIGYNTDFSGFAATYKANMPDGPAGKIAIVGAGGVGRAIAFALANLGATDLSLFDMVPRKAADLARALDGHPRRPRIALAADITEAVEGADGIVNASPVGMGGLPGTPVPDALLGSQNWAFDAVYTPVDTHFLVAARRAGLLAVSGYELFFHQGVEAFGLFTGRQPPDLQILRTRLGAPDQAGNNRPDGG